MLSNTAIARSASAKILLKVSLLVLLISVGAIAVYLSVAVFVQRNDAIKRQQELSQRISRVLSAPLWSFDEDEIYNLIGLYEEHALVAKIRVSTEDELYASNRKLAPNTTRLILDVIFEQQVIGKVEIHFHEHKLTKMVMDNAKTSLILLLAIILGLYLGYHFIVKKYLAEWLAIVDRGLDEFQKGNYNYRFPKARESDLDRVFFRLNQVISRTQDNIRDQIELRADLASANRVSDSIKRTSQMMAHDVRKPLNMIEALLEAIQDEKDSEIMTRKLRRVIPEIRYAAEMAHGLIEDVLELGRSSTLTREASSLNEIIHKAIFRIFRQRKQDNILDVKLRHRSMLNLDERRFYRPIANILENAAHAAPEGALIWIHSSEDPQTGSVILTIGNEGSQIPEEDLEKIFTPFFTKGKATGTGLGLAISRKIIEAHDGTLTCSSERKGVQFHIRLPLLAGAPEEPSVTFPSSVADVRNHWEDQGRSEGDDAIAEIRRKERATTSEILALLDDTKTTLKILVVDDESIYFDTIRSQANSFPGLSQRIELVYADDIDSAMKKVQTLRPDLILSDLDLGDESADGISLIRDIRATGYRGVIYLHSGMRDQANYKKAVEFGADGYIPKPLSRLQLLSIFMNAFENRYRIENGSNSGGKVAVVDDDPFVLEMWEGEAVRTFSSPADFLEGLADEKFDLIILDMHLNDPDWDGMRLAAKCHEMMPKAQLFLATNGDPPDGWQSYFAAVIEKKPHKIGALWDIIGGGQSSSAG